MGRGMDAMVDGAASRVSPCQWPVAAPISGRHELALVVERGEHLWETALARIEVDGRRRVLLVRMHAVDRRHITPRPEQRRGCRKVHAPRLAIREQNVDRLRWYECERVHRL